MTSRRASESHRPDPAERTERDGECCAIEYPRVLVVNGYPLTSKVATGLTLLSLFRDWPSSRLACLHFSALSSEAGVCVAEWRLGRADDRVLRFVLEALARVVPGHSRGMVGASGSAGAPITHARDRVGWLRKLIGPQYPLELSRFDVPSEVLQSVRAFAPNVIYSMLGSNRLMKLSLDLAADRAIPIVPHIMDDWLTTAYRRSILRPILRAQMARDWKRVLDRAPARLTIGRTMADEYVARYGGSFTPFMNAVERSWLEQPEVPAPAEPPVIFTYVGGLHLNRWRSLREIAVELEALRGEGLEAELHVYTQARFAEEAKRLDLPSVVRLKGSLDPRDVPAALRAAHVVVHVESFDSDSRLYTRYSVSTKIPECMASRRPMLAYGPGEVASVAYVDAVKAGLAVGARDPGILRDRLRRLIGSAELRRELGATGHDVALRHHDADRQRAAFRALLASVARGEAPKAVEGGGEGGASP